jgi:cellulose biosynthesis protein BcsQ/Tfp pilus assembly protein PilF
MHTITFYSYKGGVGRTLSLANIAKRLCEFNKKVVVLDMDLEAPGLTHKFKDELGTISPPKGIVDYIYEYAVKKTMPDNISDYSQNITFGAKHIMPMDIIPAGDMLSSDYWKKLSAINWHDMFYKQESEGIAFFMDLKQKIQKEFNPEYLLIDSRTGITETSGITIKVMADEVVIVAANNEENITGSKLVMQAITKPENLLFEKAPKIHFVLTRFSATKNIEDNIIKGIKRKLNDLPDAGYHIEEVHAIHSDRDLEISERLKIATHDTQELDTKPSQIGLDYLNLFEVLMRDKLTASDRTIFDTAIRFQKLIDKANASGTSNSDKVNLLSQAIQLDPKSDEAYYSRGSAYLDSMNYTAALADVNMAIDLNGEVSEYYFAKSLILNYHFNECNDSLEAINKSIELHQDDASYRLKGIILTSLNKFKEAHQEFQKSLELNPDNARTYNSVANTYLQQGKLEEAFTHAYKALELDSSFVTTYGTLAEIFARKGDINAFYVNIELAMKGDPVVVRYSIQHEYPELYAPYLKEERFQKLLKKYDIDLNES